MVVGQVRLDDFSMGAVLEMLVLKPPAAIRTISIRLADLREVRHTASCGSKQSCTWRAGSAAQSLVECAVLQAFELFDTDHDGVISPEQFVKVTAALGFGGSSQELLERAREADEDGNGEIGEFILSLCGILLV